MAFPTNFFDDYQSVRAAVSLSLTETDIPDKVIQLPIYQGTAIGEIEQMFPDLVIGDLYSSIAILDTNTRINYRPPFSLEIGDQETTLALIYADESKWSIEYGFYTSAGRKIDSKTETGIDILGQKTIDLNFYAPAGQTDISFYIEYSSNLSIDFAVDNNIVRTHPLGRTSDASNWRQVSGASNRWTRPDAHQNSLTSYQIIFTINAPIVPADLIGGKWDGVILTPPDGWILVPDSEISNNDQIGIALLGSDNINIKYLESFTLSSDSRLIAIYQRSSTVPSRPIGGTKVLNEANNPESPYLEPPENWSLTIPRSLTADQVTRFKSAIAYRIASRLLLSRPEVVSHSVLGVSTRWQIPDPEKKREALLAISNKLLSELAKELGVEDPISYGTLTTIFTTAKGKRGEIIDPNDVRRKNLGSGYISHILR